MPIRWSVVRFGANQPCKLAPASAASFLSPPRKFFGVWHVHAMAGALHDIGAAIPGLRFLRVLLGAAGRKVAVCASATGALNASAMIRSSAFMAGLRLRLPNVE
jgi:hypothetical protein